MPDVTPVPNLDPTLLDFVYVLSMAKYVAIGKFAEGLTEAVKRWFHLDEKIAPATRDWAYPAFALVVVALSVLGFHLLVGATFDVKLIREMVIGALGTWAALVGIVSRKNQLADRAAGKTA